MVEQVVIPIIPYNPEAEGEEDSLEILIFKGSLSVAPVVEEEKVVVYGIISKRYISKMSLEFMSNETSTKNVIGILLSVVSPRVSTLDVTGT